MGGIRWLGGISTAFVIMEVLALPYPLRTKTNQEIPSAIQERLAYLWRASSCALNARIEGETSEPLETVSASSHRLSKSFVEAARAHKVDLPVQITERLCGHCSVILIPSVTCQVRLRARSRRSKVNKSGKDKLKNQLVLRCNMCDNVWKAPGFIKKIPVKEAPTPATSAKVETNTAANAPAKGAVTKIPEKPAAAPVKSKFSFLNKAAPAKTESKDFMSFSSLGNKGTALTQANSTNLQALSKGIFARNMPAAAPAASTGSLNLLELEALNKKKKRKSTGGP